MVSAKRQSFAPHWPSLSSKRFQFFRLIIRDKEGASRAAWMRLESDCTEPELIDIVWDDTPTV
ncbi:MAG TPA: hypothetical protein VN281_17915 [Verrucomicrobiae bacterium]|nr:hypothetical protein [Verrucomicrobiae bacterium]